MTAEDLRAQLTADILHALAIAKLSQKAAAITMGMDASLWARQLYGPTSLDLARLLRLPWAFWALLIANLMSEAEEDTRSTTLLLAASRRDGTNGGAR